MFRKSHRTHLDVISCTLASFLFFFATLCVLKRREQSLVKAPAWALVFSAPCDVHKLHFIGNTLRCAA